MAKRSRRILPELTDYEINEVLPDVIKMIKRTSSRENAITAQMFMDALHIKKGRFMKIINKLRRDAVLPICSGNNGYYLTSDPQDLMDVAASLDWRCQVIRQAELGLRSMAATMQFEIDLKSKSL